MNHKSARVGWHDCSVGVGITMILQRFLRVLAFLGPLTTEVHSQTSNINFEHLSIDQGLSYTRVHSILQDSKGFLWIGTEIGLNRYDAYKFTVYKHDYRDSSSLIQNSVISIYEDKANTLWFRTYEQGIEKFDRATETFIHLLRPYSVLTMHEDSSGIVWFGTMGGGLFRFDHATEAFTQYKRDTANTNSLSCDTVLSICESRLEGSKFIWVGTRSQVVKFDEEKGQFVGSLKSSFDRVRNLYEDKQGILWIGTRQGVYRFESSTDMFGRSLIDDKRPERNFITNIYEDGNGRLWFGTKDGLARFDRVVGKFHFYRNDVRGPAQSSKQQEVRAILEDRRGMLWIGSYEGGLGVYNPTKDTFTYYTHDPMQRESLNDNIINTIYEDKSGTLWFGTVNAGAYKLDRARKPFIQFSQESNNPNSLSSTTVSAVLEDHSGVVWLGTPEGVDRYEKATGMFTHFKNDPADPHSLSTNYVWTLLQDSKGALWVGTWDGGLDRLDPDQMRRGGRFKHFRHDPHNPRSLNDNHVRHILEDRSGTVWVSTEGALSQFNRTDGTFTQFGDGAYCICEDAQGMLWLGSGGLKKFDRSTGTSTHYTHDPKNPWSLSDDGVSAIHEGRDGMLWVGTFGGGLNRFDRTTELFSTFTKKDGLPDDYIAGILEDDHGHLWLSTAKGIARFDVRTHEVKRFDASDGVNIVQGWGQAQFKNRNGEMYFGGMYGFMFFHPDSTRDNPYVPSIILTAFRKSDHIVKLDTVISEKKVIELSYKDNVFSFEFAALNYTSSEKNQYAYKLEGFDQDWVRSGTRRYATYTNLDGGSYIFRVKGSNNDGVWNEEGASVSVIVTPPYWKTWWFTTLLWLTVAGSIGGTVRFIEIRRIRERMQTIEQQQGLDRERLRISRDMHDEVGATLTEIAILSELAKREIANSATGAQAPVQKISERSREVIDNISQIIWAINPQNDHLDNLAAYLRTYAAQYFAHSSIRCRVDFPESVPDLHLSAESRRNIFLVVKEALHNVVKHSVASEVVMRLIVSNQVIAVAIEDNGKGFPLNEGTREGIGLHSMKKRAEDIGGTIEFESNQPSGTRVHLRIPMASADDEKRNKS